MRARSCGHKINSVSVGSLKFSFLAEIIFVTRSKHANKVEKSQKTPVGKNLAESLGGNLGLRELEPIPRGVYSM